MCKSDGESIYHFFHHCGGSQRFVDICVLSTRSELGNAKVSV
jgi:hypothetical protein